MTTGYDRGHGLGQACVTGAEVCTSIEQVPLRPENWGLFEGSGGGYLGGTNLGIPGPVVDLSWMFLLAVTIGAYVFIKVAD